MRLTERRLSILLASTALLAACAPSAQVESAASRDLAAAVCPSAATALAVLLPYACAYLAKAGGFGKRRSEGGFDNADPRGWLAHQQGVSARANAAQANSFEALPFFIGAVTFRPFCFNASAITCAVASPSTV